MNHNILYCVQFQKHCDMGVLEQDGHQSTWIMFTALAMKKICFSVVIME